MKNQQDNNRQGAIIAVPKVGLFFEVDRLNSYSSGDKQVFFMQGEPIGRSISLVENLVKEGGFLGPNGTYVDHVYHGDCVPSNGSWMLEQKGRMIR